MTNDRREEFLKNLRAEEALIMKSVAFWETQPAIQTMGVEWGRKHLEGLKKSLENTRQAIRILEAPNA
jgi:hypothetical protein